MTDASHQIARRFFLALATGDFPDDLLTSDMTVWTTSSGTHSPKERYIGGVKMLLSLFPDGLRYTVKSLTVEEDRVAAEVEANGILSNGDAFQNSYVFMIRLRDGKIASVAEHFNPDPVRSQIVPLIQALMAKTAG